MAESRAAAGLDRLPWLADDVAPAASGNRTARVILPWIAFVILAAAAAFYFLGDLSPLRDRPAPSDVAAPPPAATVTLPEAQPIPADPDLVNPLPQPDLAEPAEPAMPKIREVPAVRTDRPARMARAVGGTAKTPTVKREEATPSDTDEGTEEAKAIEYPRTPWPVREVEGSAGRLVQIGTFRTRHQAKRGWKAIMRVNPSLQRLPALVVPVQSKRDGKTYYRLRMGTTSQAHSTVLCQRMRMIGQSCVVIADDSAKAAE